VDQGISIAGALLILAAYGGNQFGFTDRQSLIYNLMNFVGAAALTFVAFRAGQWGFVLLEGVWTILSLPALVSATRTRLRRT
jgi:hypothetical protein